MQAQIIAQSEWGGYWARTGRLYPEWHAACCWNAHMLALHIMALEVVA